MPRTAAQLERYQSKRDFTRTAEPKPALGKGEGFRFVVQKHDATRLHFDLRLELDGVLKSWAVTRGPSMVPGVKRLAIETEDHPVDYIKWEGVIPKGEYGGGTMIVWDNGTWTAEGDARKGLEKGKLDFTLEGARLKGRFHLVRMRKKGREKAEQWLLIKSADEYAIAAGDPEPAETELTSVITGHSNDDLAKGKTIRPDHAKRAAVKKARPAAGTLKSKAARKAMLPVFVEPALPTLHEEAPMGEGWLHEIKYDGYRIEARIDGGTVKLLTRKGLDWTRRFPSIAKALKDLKLASALIDGEIIVEDDSGLSSFNGLQADLKSGRHERIVFVAFDLLYHDGKSFIDAPLTERKALLETLLKDAEAPLRFSAHLDIHDGNLLQHACRLGLEGIVSKRSDSRYPSGRSELWIKAKCILRQEFIILGYVPSMALRGSVGSLVLGYNKGREIIHAGRAGTGFTADEAKTLCAMLDKLRTKKRPVADVAASAARDVVWVKPEKVAEIQFRGWTADGLLRQAAFKGLREDKPASEIVLETARTISPKKKTAKPKDSAVSEPHLTHPDRQLWPGDGITKQDLADYYAEVVERILPHIANRPLAVVRCPDGEGHACFYAKHLWKGANAALKPVDTGDDQAMFAIKDRDGLMALVQSAVLEIHPWGSTVKKLDAPDRIIFDLDPGEGVAWDKVVNGALDIRERLKTYGLESFVKTTGGKGLHVVAPIAPKLDWDIVKDFAKDLATAMAEDDPKTYLAVMTKSRRKGRIFVDYLRNARGATAVAAFSTRARPKAPVSAPITWDELTAGIRPDQFTLTNLHQRLAALKRDPWEGFFELKQALKLKR